MLKPLRTGGALDAVLSELAAAGLNAQGVASAESAAAQELLPGAQSVLVLGSGGPALWRGMVAAMQEDPHRLTAEQHPLDAHVRRLLRAADGRLPSAWPRRWVLCGALPWEPEGEPEPALDFRRLALLAGLGHGSRLGLLLHPTAGPWLGLRAALLLDRPLPLTGPLPGAGPCEGCSAPCAAACPVSAVDAGAVAPDAAGALRFDIRACARHRARGGCPTHCASRGACPEGTTHRYDALEQHYHDNRGTGRAALAAALGISDPDHVGLGPRWAEWAGPS